MQFPEGMEDCPFNSLPFFIYEGTYLAFLRTDGLTTQDGQRFVSSDDELIVFAVTSVGRHQLKLYQIQT